ncbi:hypothetical protein L484_001966 [Morus notabilis]|uniref:DNA-directed RNA polymerase n=1 Tax=Morus notabilis TaxID=981085 RepID=W9R199_9ROSA|nr:hypothetical protein L484_001966 [Morus notabilis]
MSEDSLADRGLHRTRPALGDLTNRPIKRGFSALLGDPGVKSGDGYVKNVGGDNADSQFAKQVRLGVEKFLREQGLTLTKDKQPCGSSSTYTETDASQENTESLVSNMRREFKKPEVLDGGIHKSVVEVGDVSRDSSFSSVSMAASKEMQNKDCVVLDSEGRRASDATQSNLLQGPIVTVFKDNEGLSVGKPVSTECGSFEWSKFPKQGPISHELGRCATLQGDGCSNASVGDDFINACSCSFCLKAAHIWSDLQYQDIKGRIAALKKSKKEAHTLAQKSCREKETDTHNQGDPINSSNLESDLTGHWKSLFCHMEDIFVRENSQLVSVTSTANYLDLFLFVNGFPFGVYL